MSLVEAGPGELVDVHCPRLPAAPRPMQKVSKAVQDIINTEFVVVHWSRMPWDREGPRRKTDQRSESVCRLCFKTMQSEALRNGKTELADLVVDDLADLQLPRLRTLLEVTECTFPCLRRRPLQSSTLLTCAFTCSAVSVRQRQARFYP